MTMRGHIHQQAAEQYRHDSSNGLQPSRRNDSHRHPSQNPELKHVHVSPPYVRRRTWMRPPTAKSERAADTRQVVSWPSIAG